MKGVWINFISTSHVYFANEYSLEERHKENIYCGLIININEGTKRLRFVVWTEPPFLMGEK